MQKTLLSLAIDVLVGLLSPELLEKFINHVIDYIQDYVLGTKSDIDDRIILPLLDSLRAVINVKD